MSSYVVHLEDLDRTMVVIAGSKGAHLGELLRVEGVRVPDGFCITTDAFRHVMAQAPATLGTELDRLARLALDDRDAISEVSAGIRRSIEGITLPDDLAAAITRALDVVDRSSSPGPYAVRSSATAEDLPGASFAGQQDTYLNVVGPAAVLAHVSRCWASLFSERAVTYRLHHGFDHRKVDMAVVVQRMVFPQAAGVLFTADPVTSNRRVASVDAGFGLGEALVSGLVNPDVFKVRDGEVVEKAIAAKQRAVVPSSGPEGGTEVAAVDPERQEQPALTDEQAVRLVALGRRIEAHFGGPQDIEWCLVDGDLHVVQARPITTLFPVPAAGDDENHVYVSVGHQQMMTDAMKPLGLSVWLLTTRAPMHQAGGRLFVDVTRQLASPATRDAIVAGLGKSDPLIGDALQTVVDRDFVPLLADDGPDAPEPPPGAVPSGSPGAPPSIESDPAIVADLIARNRASVAAAERAIGDLSGPALLDFIRTDLKELQHLLFDPESYPAILAGMEAAWWINDRMDAWLGEKNAADTLTQSAPGNVTSEMGLALLDVADAIRPHPPVIAFLHQVADDGFLARLDELEGGTEARAAIEAWLDAYGMRCVGEIDITRPRWSEQPHALVPLILTDVEHFGPGERERRFEQGRQEALAKRQDLLERLRALPDGGEQKADETDRMIARLRTFIGYREYPKYGMVRRYFLYKQALLSEADRLVAAGVLRDREDVFFLTFQEIDDLVRTQQLDESLVRRRKDEFASYEALTPPRVLTSDGEMLTGSYRRDDVPPDALVGLPVSAGTVEGRARVILDMAQADLEPGDILVTAHTDPSWTPLFVAVAGLVTEVGGLMTHGAVIAREYGLPAVVGVEDATTLIPDGQRIRVHGSAGHVELLPTP
jgi:pyruvate,water dikinase